MIIHTLPVGPIMANCHIVGDPQTNQAAVIDPGDEAERILDELQARTLTVACIINTHGHFDHVGGNKELKAATGAPLMIHPGDAPMLDQLDRSAAMFGMRMQNSPPADQLINDGETIAVGDLILTVIHTPGHSPGGICLHVENHLFAGDTLFAGSIGRTDLPGGDYETLISSVHQKLFGLNPDTQVHCGHGPSTTLRKERQKRFNPFVGIE